MDEEERKRMEQQMLMGMTSQNATLPEQPAPQAPIAPQAQAPAPQAQAPVTQPQIPATGSGVTPALPAMPTIDQAAPAMEPIPDPNEVALPSQVVLSSDVGTTTPILGGAPGSPQENFRQRMLTGEPLTPQEIAKAFAFSIS